MLLHGQTPIDSIVAEYFYGNKYCFRKENLLSQNISFVVLRNCSKLFDSHILMIFSY